MEDDLEVGDYVIIKGGPKAKMLVKKLTATHATCDFRDGGTQDFLRTMLEKASPPVKVGIQQLGGKKRR